MEHLVMSMAMVSPSSTKAMGPPWAASGQIESPYSQDGGIAVLKGNLAPEGCVVKRSAVAS